LRKDDTRSAADAIHWAMAGHLGLRMAAKGIESDEQARKRGASARENHVTVEAWQFMMHSCN
jgi:sensor c-di-GMP phosphodiesterase-like protein